MADKKLRNPTSDQRPATSDKLPVLLNPGPVRLSAPVRQALSRPEICHREPEFTELLFRVQKKLLGALKLSNAFRVCFFSGSGTAAVESAVASVVSPGRKLLVLTNGVYGDRMIEMARAHRIPVKILRVPFNQTFSAERLKEILRRDRMIEWVGIVHHETSTGMLNPVESIGRAAASCGRRLLVDAISSLGAEPLNLRGAHVDVLAASAGKCLHGPPGLSFVLASRKLRVPKRSAPRSVYLDLWSNLEAQEAGRPAFTPAVPLFYSFERALDELLKEGLARRIARYRARAQRLRAGFNRLGLSYLIPESAQSSVLTSLKLPDGFTYPRLHDALKKRGFVIYAGQHKLSSRIFRAAHMGEISNSDLDRFLDCLGHLIANGKEKT